MTNSICFSGDCGICDNCSNNTRDSFSQKIDYSKHGCVRGDNLSKIMGPKYVQEFKDRYNKNLLRWAKRYQFKDPFCYGYAPQKIRSSCSGKSEVFHIIDETHSAICDHPYCKMMYSSSTEWEHMSKYPSLPMYTNENDSLQFCGPCMNNESFS